MNIKNFFTKRNILCLIGGGTIVVVIIVLFFFIGRKPSKDLSVSVDIAWNSAKAEEMPTYLIELDKLSSYTLNSVKKEGDRYIISATVIAPDLGAQLFMLDYSEFPQEKNVENINDFLCDQIKESQIKKTNVEIYAYKINGEYHIIFSDDFADAMSGKLYRYSQMAYLEILQKYEEGELK